MYKPTNRQNKVASVISNADTTPNKVCLNMLSESPKELPNYLKFVAKVLTFLFKYSPKSQANSATITYGWIYIFQYVKHSVIINNWNNSCFLSHSIPVWETYIIFPGFTVMDII